MILLPFENITYRSKLKPEEILERLSRVVMSTLNIYGKTGFSFNDSEKEYRGEVEQNAFQIERIIKNKNSYLPVISGQISRHGSGSKIHVKMRLPYSSGLFLLLWMAIPGYMLYTYVFNHGLDKDQTAFWISFSMIVFGYAMAMFGFKKESIKSKKYFALLFEAEKESGQRNRKSGRKRYLK